MKWKSTSIAREKQVEVWIFRRADGATEEMPAGDLMDSVQDELVERLEARGIRVTDATD